MRREEAMSRIKTFGDVDARSLGQLQRCMDAGDAAFGVLCADHHPGYSQPIGGGIAYEGYVSPSGVGYDIGCGNKAVQTKLTRSDLDALGGVETVMREIARRISFGMGVAATERVDHPVLDKIRSADFAPQRKLAELAESQLGTVGSAEAVHEVHNHHNFAWREEHFGRVYWVIRKGCTPARPGQEGFVGGSMGDDSVILEGVAGVDADESLHSTVHGAGRVMSRTQAAGRVRRRKRCACTHRDCPHVAESPGTCPEHGGNLRKVWIEEQVKRGVVDWPAVQARLREQGIVLIGGGADEAPEVYKRLPEVLAAHGGTIRVKHTLRPLGVAMAGRDVVDPYKD
jgi:RNA-splicing ligase RtcB